MEYNRKSHSVYLLTYHIVFVTKYRKPVITNEIGDFMKNLAGYLCNSCVTDLDVNLYQQKQTETICILWYQCPRMLHPQN